MADDENKTDNSAAEGAESPATERTDEGPAKAPPKKAAAKKSVKKAAPKKKAPAKKAAKPKTEAAVATAATVGSAQQAGEKPAAVDTARDKVRSKRPSPPKSFWWQALLMVVVVIFLFSVIRDMTRGPQADATAPRGDAGAIISTIPNGQSGNVITEEAPSQPSSGTAMPAPGYYGYPYPPQQPYYAQPPQGNGMSVPPQAPQGSYGYPYPQQRPYYPQYNPWQPSYPAQAAPEQQ